VILGGILVGGRSRRMGRTKAEITFDGRRLDAIARAALAPHCHTVRHLGPDGLPDAPGLAGPLAGIMAALAHAPEVWWVIVACDMPLVTPEAVRWLLDVPRGEAAAVLPTTEAGGPQPTLALYGPASRGLLSAVTAPIQLVGQTGVLSPVVPPDLARCWTNVNHPEELDALVGSRGE